MSSSSLTKGEVGLPIRTVKVAANGCIGLLVARQQSAATDTDIEPEIVYEHCVKPSGVRHASSAATGAVASCSPCSIESTTLIVPKFLSATKKEDKSMQTTLTGATVEVVSATTAATEAAKATTDGVNNTGSDNSGSGIQQQANEEVHTAEAEDAEANADDDDDVGWSSDAPVSTTTSLSGRSGSCDSLNTWPTPTTKTTTTTTTTIHGTGPASKSRKRSKPLPHYHQQHHKQQIKRRQRRKQLSLIYNQQDEQPKIKAALGQSDDKELEALPSTGRSAEAAKNSTLPQAQQQRLPANQRMPLLAWSPGYRFDRPVRRAVRKVSNFILFATLAMGVSALLQWNFLTYHCQAGRDLADTPVTTYRLY